MRIEGKVAIVTGSGQGIGKGIAMLFAAEGARVVVCDRDPVTARRVADEIKCAGGTAMSVAADVSSRADVEALARKAIDSFGEIHILVNNAGLFLGSRLLDITDKQWNVTLDVDLKGVLYCMQAVVPYMIGQRYGKVVNIASVAAFAGSENMASYAAAKAGVMQLTKVAAHEFGRHNINVNAVAPGTVITEGSVGQRTAEQIDRYVKEREELASLRRVGRPEDIARVVLFLASDDSGFITGQTIVADGGRSDYMA